MRKYNLCFIVLILLFSGVGKITSSDNPNGIKLLPPPEGIYHAAFPDFGWQEDNVTSKRIADFEKLAGKQIVWAYFSNNWGDNIIFPKTSVKIIDSCGAIPFIRMMSWDVYNPKDPTYSMQDIIDGRYDEDLIRWAQDARSTNISLMVEFGPEVNGE